MKHTKRNHQQCLSPPHLVLLISPHKPKHKAMDTRSLSTQGAVLCVFFFTAFVAIGLCASVVVKKRRIQSEQSRDAPNETEQSESGWSEIRKVLLNSLHLGDASQAVEPERKNWQEKAEKVTANAAIVTNTPPLWQRRILMGEKCEMPKFSGLILYDERGRPLQGNSSNRAAPVQQEKQAVAVTTLKDLL